MAEIYMVKLKEWGAAFPSLLNIFSPGVRDMIVTSQESQAILTGTNGVGRRSRLVRWRMLGL